MPQIGGLYIADAAMPTVEAGSARPGWGKLLGDAAKQSYAQVRYGLPLEAKVLTGSATPEDQRYAADQLAAASAGAANPASVDELLAGRVGLGRFLGENFVASLPSMVGMAAGGALGAARGGATGAIVGSIAGGVPQFVGSNVDRAVQETGGLSQAAAARSLAAAPLQSAADAAIGAFIPGAGHVIGDLAAKQAGGFVRRVAVGALKGGATEAVTEAGQQAGERWAAGKPLDNAEAAKEYVNAAVTAFGLGGVIGGAGGAVNRGPASTKPAAEATTEDLLAEVNLALPSPEMLGRRAAGVDGDGNTKYAPQPQQSNFPLTPIPANPELEASIGEKHAFPPTPIANTPAVIVDSAGRALAPDQSARTPDEVATLLANASRPESVGLHNAPQDLLDALAGRRAPTADEIYQELAAPNALAQPGVRPFDPAALPSSQPVVSGLPEGAPGRQFEGVADEDLKKVARSTSTDPEHAPIIAAAIAELDARKAATPVEDLLAKVRKNQDIAKLVGKPIEEQRTALQTLLDNGDDRKTTLDAAAAVGIDTTVKGEAAPTISLDEQPATVPEVSKQDKAAIPPLPPEASVRQQGAIVPEIAPEAAPITQENATKLEMPSAVAQTGLGGDQATSTAGAVAAASPKPQSIEIPTGSQTDPQLTAKWDALKSGVSQRLPADHWAQSFTPTSEADLEAKVVTELANGTDTLGRGGLDATDRMAQQLGLVTGDKDADFTPKGRKVWLSTGAGLEETIAAAGEQGYAGKQASVFERGARDAAAGTKTARHEGFEDWQAYEQGHAWATSFIQKGDVRTAAETRAIQERNQGNYVGRALEPGQEAPTNDRLQGRALEQAAQNRMLDAMDLRGVQDTDIAMLRRRIRDGISSTELGQLIQQVQGGKTLFREAPRSEAPPLSKPDGRGQPVFKEINQQAAGPQRAQLRAETEGALETYRLRSLIEFARSEKAITEARAQRLHDLLDQGKVEQVARNMRAFDPDAAPRAPRAPKTQAEAQTQRELQQATPPEKLFERDPIGRALGAHDLELERELDGKSFGEAISHLVANAPSRYYREVMKMVGALQKRLEKAGVQFHFFVVHEGDKVPARLNRSGVRALAWFGHEPAEAAVYLKGADLGLDAGVNMQIAAHEMLHAVTIAAIEHGMKLKNDTKLAKAVKDLNDLRNAVIDHFNARASSGKLTPFEDEYFRRQNNSLDNADELLAWGMTNPDMQRYLASIEYKPRQSVFGRLVELLRNLLGLDAKYDTALTELLRVSEQILNPSDRDIAAVFRRNDVDENLAPTTAEAYETGTTARTAEAINTVTKTAANLAGKVAEALNARVVTQENRTQVRRKMLGAISHNQIDRMFGEAVPGSIEHSAAHRERTAVRSRFEHIGEQAYQNFEALEKAKPQHAKWVGQLMATTTEFQVDPTRKWDEHTWIADEEKARIKPLYDQAVKMKNDLSRGDGAGWKAYQEFRALNEAQNFARMAVNLHSLVVLDPELRLGIEDSWVNPADVFMRADNVSSAQQVRDHWAKALDDQVKAAIDFVREKKGQYVDSSAGDKAALSRHLSPLEAEISNTIEAKRAMDKAPYFHLGRFGDNYGAANIVKGADGKVDPRAQRAVAAALEKAGFTDAQISADNTRPRIMLRLDKVDQVLQLEKVIKELEAQGHIEAGTWEGGPRNRASNYGVAEGIPVSIETLIQNIKDSPAFAIDDTMTAEEKAAVQSKAFAAEQAIRDAWLESQADTSIAKVLVRRYTVPGYNADMIRNWAHRWRVGSIHIANMSAQPKFNQAFTNMQAQFEEAKLKDTKGAYTVQDIAHELRMRDARTPVNEVADTLDKARGLAHSYFLGFSPAYGMVNLTQLGVTALPELAKTHGYAKSFHAMRRASSQAIAVVKAVAAEANRLGWKHWGDVAITDRVLRNAGLDEQTRNFVTHMLATGTIDIGSMARSLGQVADDKGVGGKLDTYLKLSSAVGLYTETFSRLVTALAARDLHGSFGDDAKAYASKVVSESMFDYQSWNTARYLGKQGLLGPVTPILTQFMSYQVQMLEKLYSEFGSAIGRVRPGETAADAAARAASSRRFLAGHLAAVTALAGTLGLPFASVFANVLDRLFGDDDEPFDAAAAYRDFLASVLGKDMGEVLARGLPRALGVDLSTRTGEQDILPFTSFLTDKRSWKESLQANVGRGLGAAPSMIINIADGGAMIADGDVLGGMKMVLPVAFKSGTEFYRMQAEGYVDSKGNKLPLSPNSSAYLWQLLGFTPAAKAEYSEARQDQMIRRGELSRRAGTLRKQIVDAITSGDTAKAQELVGDATAFDQANPAYAVIPSLAGAVQARASARQRAVALQAPMGVSLNDIAGQGLTRYANVDYQ